MCYDSFHSNGWVIYMWHDKCITSYVSYMWHGWVLCVIHVTWVSHMCHKCDMGLSYMSYMWHGSVICVMCATCRSHACPTAKAQPWHFPLTMPPNIHPGRKKNSDSSAQFQMRPADSNRKFSIWSLCKFNKNSDDKFIICKAQNSSAQIAFQTINLSSKKLFQMIKVYHLNSSFRW